MRKALRPVTEPYFLETNYAIGYENVQLGQCVAMALKDDLIKVGQWINTDCGGTLTTVCKRGNSSTVTSFNLEQMW